MYEDFSYIYDKLSFDIDYEGYAKNILSLVDKYNIKKENMLELAAGSGMLTQYFFDEFKNIDALDISTDMLNVFASKYDNNNVNLIYYDMLEFENPNKYDLIVILLDSINYVTDQKELKKLFNNCYKNLKDNGLLVFDINSEYKMTEIFGSNCYVYEYEDIFYTWDNFYEDDLVDMHLNFFVENENGSYDRIYEYQQERVYSIEEIKNMVSKSGFEEIKIYDEDDFSSIKEDSQRILISAVKGK
ncbi:MULTISPECIES: class I SAM-dependent methyltransferase [Anaerococcus]|jgi:methyltransferase type 11|uniref:Bifunctional 3-demethylubiquinone-9 3-methyltransferase/ 2-octaprenyl-6-hydroxy phenol methylase n=1 Tax=Anaerococcus octavius TaxID=54007 RepID=A0A2I1M8J1_9FIRM|nr:MULTISPECIES: class I SAM-dependent methyltransferase [Anaerococcus]MBS6105997.1 class I SAM-dependent methyltransferase [Anaerococcus sp.]MDU4025937.1 methyltransferase [Anaerococcus sp.]MDU5535527.1 methyltransferase [Anaerococcus sp.]PKZ16440.1 class I SAM-dependent methyltransferase [Anaerococcus octavius]SUU92516.1 bifunctional 3-demethylubiquinone-9 3-methyltransferase/ 2-octaprenyl-6-hydroxy phenol methylase [Anaerococcus octavius]